MISQLTSAVRRVEQFFGPNNGWVETLRKTVWQRAQSVLGDTHTFVRHKGTADYVATVDAPAQRVVSALYSNGYQRNILSTVKTRGNPPQYVHSAWVLDTENTEWQQDVFIWGNRDGTTDVYSHKEPSVRNPKEHLDLSTGIHGDPDGRVCEVLDEAGLQYETTKY